MSFRRRILNWHEDTAVVEWWQCQVSRPLNLAKGRRRRNVLALAAVGLGTSHLFGVMAWLGSEPPLANLASASLTIVAVFAVLGFCYHQAAHFSSLPPLFRRHPQVCLHLLFWGVILLLWKTSVDDGAWRVALVGFATILPTILWRLGYLLQSGQRARVAGTRFTDHLLYLLPWGPDLTVAYGKGLDYLARHEARDEDALARCQLAGVKLILLAILWKVVLSLLQGLVHGSQNWANRGLRGFAMTPLPASLGNCWLWAVMRRSGIRGSASITNWCGRHSNWR